VKNIYILGIESSCDDTSASVIYNGKVLSNIIANQEVHAKYGGVVPELASRAHQQNILPVVHQAIEQAGIKKEQLSAIAFTRGPGLMGSLLVGTSFAKSLALGLQIPLIDVNHMQAHILAHFIEEAYDKSAKILGLPYPGGPLVDKYAQLGNPKAFQFTKPKVGDLEFSFSGLKTQILYFVQKKTKENPNFIKENLHDICASIQYTIIEILIGKLKNAVKQTGIKQIAIAGGVSANSEIRKRLKTAQKHWNWTTYVPKFQYTTDNAAMIAITGYLKYLNNEYSDVSISAKARLKVTE